MAHIQAYIFEYLVARECHNWTGIRRRGLVERGVSLGMGLGFQKLKPGPGPFLFLLPVSPDAEISVTLQHHHVCLQATMLPAMMTKESN